jgi:hypothetical protein
MPVNTQIAMGVNPMQLQMPNPDAGLNSLLRAMQIKDAQQSSQVNALKFQELQRGVTDTNAVNEAYKGALGPDGALDRNKLFSTLATGGKGSKIPDLQKKFLDTDTAGANLQKTKIETQKAELEAGIKKTEHVASVLSQANPANYGVVRQVVKNQYGVELPEQFDPAFVSATIAQGQTLTQRLAAEHQRLTLAETTTHNRNSEGIQVRGQDISASTARRGQDITVRGQDMTDARTRETTAAQITKPFEITGEDGRPVLVQQDRQGNIRPVQGYGPKQGASKPLNDTQAKALQFGARMQAAEETLGELSGKGVITSIPGSRGGYGVGSAINALQPADRQRLDQAKRDFINAVLRRESGAAISSSEFDSAEKQYFPQPGETDKSILEQKKRNRQLATRGILAEVPDSENRVAAVRGGSTTAAPTQIDELLKKYGGK